MFPNTTNFNTEIHSFDISNTRIFCELFQNSYLILFFIQLRNRIKTKNIIFMIPKVDYIKIFFLLHRLQKNMTLNQIIRPVRIVVCNFL